MKKLLFVTMSLLLVFTVSSPKKVFALTCDEELTNCIADCVNEGDPPIGGSNFTCRWWCTYFYSQCQRGGHCNLATGCWEPT